MRREPIPVSDLIKLAAIIPFRALVVGLFFFISLLVFNVSLWKSIVVLCVVFVSLAASLGRKYLSILGLLVASYALAYWVGAAPAPSDLQRAVMSCAGSARSSVLSSINSLAALR